MLNLEVKSKLQRTRAVICHKMGNILRKQQSGSAIGILSALYLLVNTLYLFLSRVGLNIK